MRTHGSGYSAAHDAAQRRFPIRSGVTLDAVHQGRRGFSRSSRFPGRPINFLGLAFGGQDGTPIDVDVMDIKPDEPRRLEASDVEAEVCDGIAAANETFGTAYRVNRIQFVPSDSPPVETYRELAMKLIERLARNEPFTSVNN